MRRVAECIEYQKKSSICTHRAVYSYNNTHDYVSVRRVCKHVSVAR